MDPSNPYETPPDSACPSRDHPQSEANMSYSYIRGVAVYVASCLFLWLFVAPFIAPTDVAPEGAPPVPSYLIAIQVTVCYGVPGLLTFLDSRRSGTQSGSD